MKSFNSIKVFKYIKLKLAIPKLEMRLAMVNANCGAIKKFDAKRSSSSMWSRSWLESTTIVQAAASFINKLLARLCQKKGYVVALMIGVTEATS